MNRCRPPRALEKPRAGPWSPPAVVLFRDVDELREVGLADRLDRAVIWKALQELEAASRSRVLGGAAPRY